MDASNILISKAGGVTSSGTNAKSVPMLIVAPIPNQESRNTDMIIEHGAGWKAFTVATFSYKLRHAIESPSKLAEARSSTLLLSKPLAATTILTYIYNYV
jgi:processive 1,2-diacylglycerol beta-glucosyltransferase